MKKGKEIKLFKGESEKKTMSRSGSGIRDEHPGSYSESLETIVWFKNTILKFFDADPDSGSGIFLTLDPGLKNSNPG
jgi:hypothetical protein